MESEMGGVEKNVLIEVTHYKDMSPPRSGLKPGIIYAANPLPEGSGNVDEKTQDLAIISYMAEARLYVYFLPRPSGNGNVDEKTQDLAIINYLAKAPLYIYFLPRPSGRGSG